MAGCHFLRKTPGPSIKNSEWSEVRNPAVGHFEVYRIGDPALGDCLPTRSSVEQWRDMSKGKLQREGLTGACRWYAIGERKVPVPGGSSAILP